MHNRVIVAFAIPTGSQHTTTPASLPIVALFLQCCHYTVEKLFHRHIIPKPLNDEIMGEK